MKEFNLNYIKEHWKEAQAGNIVQTKDGKPVRLLCLDAKRNYPIIGLINVSTTEDLLETWTIEGKYDNQGNKSSSDLAIQSVKRKGWMNIYQDIKGHPPYGGTVFNTKESALNVDKKAIATIEVEWEE